MPQLGVAFHAAFGRRQRPHTFVVHVEEGRVCLFGQVKFVGEFQPRDGLLARHIRRLGGQVLDGGHEVGEGGVALAAYAIVHGME